MIGSRLFLNQRLSEMDLEGFCLNCGKEFVSPWNVHNKKFCSVKCNNSYRVKELIEAMK